MTKKEEKKEEKKKEKQLKEWVKENLRKGYNLSHLREILISRGLKKEADKLTKLSKTYSPKRKKINVILLVLACVITLALVFALVSILNKEGNLPLRGYFISESENPGALINVNFSDEVGVVREDFYGVNLGNGGGSNQSLIDINDDETLDTLSNYTWHRNALQNGNINYLRIDTDLHWLANETGFVSNPSDNAHNIQIKKDLVTYAKENNMKILFNVKNMPHYINNESSPWCTSYDYYITCPPNNYTQAGDLVVSFLQYVGCDANTCEVEIGNEMANTEFWLDNLPSDNGGANDSIRSIEFNKLYNATYLAVKLAYPTMQVGGIGGSFNSYLGYAWAGNFSNMTDFVSIHIYNYQGGATNENFYDYLNGQYENISNSITTYNINATRIILSEFNVWDESIKINESANWGKEIASVYAISLNKYPKNISLTYYNWMDYQNTTSSLFQMVSEPQLKNTYYPPYNITKNFATYHSAGSTIVKSNSSSNNIKVVASKKNDTQYITVINTGSEINVGLNIFGENISQIKDLETNEIYNVTDGGVYIGNISKYEIRYFIILNNSVPAEEDEPGPYCGDGIINQANETCDDRNLIEGDGCSANCETEEEPPYENNFIENNENNFLNIEEGEECTDINLINETCESYGYTSGELFYDDGCVINTSNCINNSDNLNNTILNKGGIFSRIFRNRTIKITSLSYDNTTGIASDNNTENNKIILNEVNLSYPDNNLANNNNSNPGGDNKDKASSKSSKKDRRIAEKSDSEISETGISNFISGVKGLKNNPLIIILIIVVIILGILDVVYLYEKRRYNKLLMLRLNDWVKRAKALGYTYTKMKTLLETTNWDKKLIKKALEENGVEREGFY